MKVFPALSEIDLKKVFPFELDDFQLQAIAALNAGRSVVVCAPTGSGKTLIGEYAIYRALNRGGRVFYTTPLKALSNQKLRDFRDRFGVEQVGLLTGDISINRDAPILVMTTEIFRNMLYGTPIGEVGTSLVGVEAVVLDECHYMNDRQRGTVWEESIIYCPPEVQLVALSATVANSDQLTDWLNRVHGETELIYSDFRPVPLEFHFCSPKGLFPLLNDDLSDINPRLKQKKSKDKGGRTNRHSAVESQNISGAIKNLQARDLLPTIYYVYSRRACDRVISELGNLTLVNAQEASELKHQLDEFLKRNPELAQPRQIKSIIEPLSRGISAYHIEVPPVARSLIAKLFKQGLVKVLFVPETLYTISQLRQRDMLPAIYFIFSRAGCDMAVQESDIAVRELGIYSLVNAQEAAELKTRIDDFLARNPDAGRSGQIEPLYRGIAAHHAGILPAWKGLVEELFGLGLIKIVFATETLAAGINMPARTTVISSISKRTDDGHRLLTASEFLQMAGRAGRRGMDTTGHVVTLQTPFEGAEHASALATMGADPLKSQFTPSYGMVLNLLQTHTIEQAQALIERSFAQYLATLYLKPQDDEIAGLKAELAKIEAELEGVDLEALANYAKLSERLKEERRLLKTLENQAQKVRAREISLALAEAAPGTILHLKGKNVLVSSPLPAILIQKAGSRGQSSYLVCLAQDNRWYVVTTSDVVGCSLNDRLPNNYQSLPLPPAELHIKPGDRRKGTEATAELAAHIPATYKPVTQEPEVMAQLQHLEAVKALLETHPVRQFGNPATLLDRQEQGVMLQEEIDKRQEKINVIRARHWQEFLDLIEILQRMGGLSGLNPTPLGEAAAAIRGDNELWLGLALISGNMDELDPHHLASACAALVTETPRPDTWTTYGPSPQVEDSLSELRGPRRSLFQMQRRYNVALPVWLEYDLIGLVEQWALGVEWLEICRNTSLDEGDVVRLFRRTVDFLSQIPHVPHTADSLRRNAIRAIQLIDRFPVNEVLA